MADKKAPADTSTFYKELSKLQQSQDYEKALKVCNKILNVTPSDTTAFHCKIVCMVQLAKFEDAIRFIHDTHFDVDLIFEEAYCLYRLNETAKALEVIDQAKNPDVKHKELKAQILYRLEDYDNSYDVYKDILKNSSDDEFQAERLTNVAAVAVNLKKETKLSHLDDQEETFEMIYNRACYLLAHGKYVEAEKMLKKSEELCKASFEEDEETDAEDIEREVSVIRAQLGFAIQMQGREKEAQAVYNNVLKAKPTDVALVAVVSNNLIAVNKEQNIFDSKKKIKAATADELQHKLTSAHRSIIARNHAVLAMYTNQVELCKTLIKDWANHFDDVSPEDQVKIVAGVLTRSGKSQEAANLLLTSNVGELEKRLISAQIFLEKGEVEKAIRVLEGLPTSDKYRNGVLSALVALHLACEGRSKAAQLLKEAVELKSKEKPNKSDMKVVWRKTAEFHLKGDDPKIAAQCLEQLLESNKQDITTMAQLVLAYARFDLKKALEASKKLPTFTQKAVDVDALEASSFLGSKMVKKTPKVGSVPSPAVGEGTDLAPKKKHKKNRKKRLPKNYNPNIDPDPERWLPRRERTAYKRRKDRRNKHEKFTGAQGTAAGQSEAFDYSSKKASTPTTGAKSGATPKSPALELGVGPRQQRKQQPKQKKKSKRF